jgi:hypothetical protein
MISSTSSSSSSFSFSSYYLPLGARFVAMVTPALKKHFKSQGVQIIPLKEVSGFGGFWSSESEVTSR